MKPLLLVVMLLVGVSTTSTTPVAAEPGSITGLWDAVIAANGVEVPFRFEIAQNGATTEGFFFEGDRKVGSTGGRFADGLLTLDYDFLNTTLQLKLEGVELVGSYRNKRANAKPQD